MHITEIVAILADARAKLHEAFNGLVDRANETLADDRDGETSSGSCQHRQAGQIEAAMRIIKSVGDSLDREHGYDVDAGGAA